MVKEYISKDDISKKVKEIAISIREDYPNEPLVILGILKGASVFVSDLLKEIKGDVTLDFIAVSSYGNKTTTSGVVQLLKDVDVDIEDKVVIVVEDIVDTGLTLAYLQKYLSQRNPKTVRICTLLDKKERRQAEIPLDYVGFEIEDLFVVGYGIDYAEKYRNLPYVGVFYDE